MQIGTAEQEALFDIIPDVVYFAKDREGRYTSVNETLVLRCGKQHKREAAQAPDRGAEEQDVEDDLRAAAFVLARQKIVCAHAEAERQNRDCRPDDEEDLLEESVLGLRQASD